MPILVDPEQVLPEKHKRASASQVITFLMYPVIFIVGIVVGIAIGIKEAPAFNTKNTNTVKTYSNSKIVSNLPVNHNTNVIANTNRNTNAATNANTNIPAFMNTNVIPGGDYARLNAQTESLLQTQKQSDLDRLVDTTADTVDILRQQDLIALKYNLLTYKAVRDNFPSTDSKQVHLDRSENDVLYTSLKDFYGGSFYERIDPQSPQYYYGYTSDGESFTLSAYLVSKKKAYYLTDSD